MVMFDMRFDPYNRLCFVGVCNQENPFLYVHRIGSKWTRSNPNHVLLGIESLETRMQSYLNVYEVVIVIVVYFERSYECLYSLPVKIASMSFSRETLGYST